MPANRMWEVRTWGGIIGVTGRVRRKSSLSLSCSPPEACGMLPVQTLMGTVTRPSASVWARPVIRRSGSCAAASVVSWSKRRRWQRLGRAAGGLYLLIRHARCGRLW